MTTVGSNPNVINSAVGQIAKVPINLNNSLLNQNVVRITPLSDIIKNEHLYNCLRMHSFRKYLDLNAHGTANQSSLSLVDILNYYIPLPHLSEQTEIAAYLDQKCTAIDSAIAKKETLIEKLTEYKKSLIYEAVTGKIDVPERCSVN